MTKFPGINIKKMYIITTFEFVSSPGPLHLWVMCNKLFQKQYAQILLDGHVIREVAELGYYPNLKRLVATTIPGEFSDDRATFLHEPTGCMSTIYGIGDQTSIYSGPLPNARVPYNILGSPMETHNYIQKLGKYCIYPTEHFESAVLEGPKYAIRTRQIPDVPTTRELMSAASHIMFDTCRSFLDLRAGYMYRHPELKEAEAEAELEAKFAAEQRNRDIIKAAENCMHFARSFEQRNQRECEYD